jgi:glycosidase
MWCNGSKEIGVTDPPKLPDTAEPFSKVRAAFAILMTLPGIPLLYYGDEVGLPGAGDPDNRRMMPFDGLTERQKALKADVGTLGKLRAAHPATRTGDFKKLAGDKDTLAFVVYGGGDAVVTAVNRGANPAPMTLAIPAEAGLSGTLKDALGGGDVAVTGGQATVTVPAYGAVVLVGK